MKSLHLTKGLIVSIIGLVITLTSVSVNFAFKNWAANNATNAISIFTVGLVGIVVMFIGNRMMRNERKTQPTLTTNPQ